VLLNLGREDRLDPDGLRRLVRSINRYLGEPDSGTDAAAETGTDAAAEGVSADNRDTASDQGGQGEGTDLTVNVHSPAQHDFRRGRPFGYLMLTRVLSWLTLFARSTRPRTRDGRPG
jgi:hypothetical protein